MNAENEPTPALPSTPPETGLDDAAAARQLAESGYNELPNEGKRSFARLALSVVSEPMFLLLLSCVAVYALLGEPQEAAMLGAAIVVMIAITLVQEQRTESALSALRALAVADVMVVRGGRSLRVPSRNVVPGDLIQVREGDRVAADGVMITATNVAADESLLTGESVSVRKCVATGPIDAMTAPGGDDQPCVFSGSMIIQGAGIARVLATGPSTAIGKIGGALAGIRQEPARIQRETAAIVKVVAIGAAVISALLAIYYGASRGDWLQGLLAGLTLAMSALPEELPVVLVVFLGIGAWRIAQNGVLTRQVAAIEMLGAITALCVDKTGTLTENRMAVNCLSVDGSMTDVMPAAAGLLPEPFHEVLEYAILAGHRDPFDPMEKAINAAGRGGLAGTEHLHADWVLVDEYPLSPELLAMSRVWQSPNKTNYVIAAKGAPEAIAGLCHLAPDALGRLEQQVNALATRGLRVLGVARAEFSHAAQAFSPTSPLPDLQHDFDFAFCGLIGLADPLRTDVPPAIQKCHIAGIRVLMITGDFPATALEIARQAGIDVGKGALAGADLELLDDTALARAVGEINVFCRMTPQQKLRLVEALKGNGEIVAMTGDGVNDAPALKAAHVGIAMGTRGTDVAREAAALVLLNDNFSAIVDTIGAGRRIFDNLRKAFAFLVATHLPIVGMALIPVALGLPLVLLPVHIMFLELIIAPVCSIVFEMEEADANTMARPPRLPREPLFNRATVMLGIAQGCALLVAVLFAYFWSMRQFADSDLARTMAFTTLAAANLALIVANRARAGSLLATLLKSNRAFWWVTLMMLSMLATALYVPAVRNLFMFKLPNAGGFTVCALAIMAALLGFEVIRRLLAKRLD